MVIVDDANKGDLRLNLETAQRKCMQVIQWSCFAETFSVQVGLVLASRRRTPPVGGFVPYLKACIVRNVGRWVGR
jgi:hypothetical protein